MGKKEAILCRNGQIDKKLMKPFALGWTREVVKRVQAKNPTCDVYYFNPRGKRLRSLREVKDYLTDGLSPDCFSFKREILGVDSKFESIRDATIRKRKSEKTQQAEAEVNVESESKPSGTQKSKRNKIKVENPDSNSEEENAEREGEDVETIVGEEAESNAQRETASEASKENLTTKRERKTVLAAVSLKQVERKIFKRVMRKVVRQNQLLARKKLLKKAAGKAAKLKSKVTKSESKYKAGTGLRSNEKRLSSTGQKTGSKKNKALRSREKSVSSVYTETKDKKDEPDMKRNEISVQSTSSQGESEEEDREVEGTEESKDLRSLVQKNIVKYRKLREKQKLKLIRTQMSRNRCNISRAESFLKNKSNYLKPLQKGWTRELVYRSNCSKNGLHADVYYIHPSGKKFRSTREIMDSPELLRGLSLDLFTFRKEAVGCGEPLEVIRSARTYKN